jgi:hypothetical protein
MTGFSRADSYHSTAPATTSRIKRSIRSWKRCHACRGMDGPTHESFLTGASLRGSRCARLSYSAGALVSRAVATGAERTTALSRAGNRLLRPAGRTRRWGALSPSDESIRRTTSGSSPSAGVDICGRRCPASICRFPLLADRCRMDRGISALGTLAIIERTARIHRKRIPVL